MKVTITTAGHTIEIESSDPDMTVHRLANIAVNAWRRTKDDVDLADAWGPHSCGTERRGAGWGFTWRLGRNDQLDVQ